MVPSIKLPEPRAGLVGARWSPSVRHVSYGFCIILSSCHGGDTFHAFDQYWTLLRLVILQHRVTWYVVARHMYPKYTYRDVASYHGDSQTAPTSSSSRITCKQVVPETALERPAASGRVTSAQAKTCGGCTVLYKNEALPRDCRRENTWE